MRLALLSLGQPAATVAALAAGLDLPAGRSASDAAGVDRALDDLAGCDRLVIAAAELAGLNLVLSRVQRKGLLGALDTAVLLDAPGDYLTGLGLPGERAAQLALAQHAPARLVGVIKDDSGGVLVDSALLHAWAEPGAPAGGAGWWVRAVVDDQRLCDGPVRSLTVRRLGPSSLEATVRLGRWRSRSCQGRSLQLACDPAQIVADGVGRAQPRRKRTFWSEPELWRLALPSR
ncbi:MAG: hypothetical protein ABI140_16815 [Jatrophihabitantaceae bacterium]